MKQTDQKHKKRIWKPGTMLSPVPPTLVSCGNEALGYNMITIAWTGIINSKPPMTYISVRPERYSYNLIKETGEFVINITTKKLARATDWCGVKSGQDVDKFKETGLTPVPGSKISAPLIAESPLNLECKVTEVKNLGSHDMFLAEIVAVQASEMFIDEKTGKFSLEASNPIAYAHGNYYTLGKMLGGFGYTVMKKSTKKKRKQQKAKK